MRILPLIALAAVALAGCSADPDSTGDAGSSPGVTPAMPSTLDIFGSTLSYVAGDLRFDIQYAFNTTAVASTGELVPTRVFRVVFHTSEFLYTHYVFSDPVGKLVGFRHSCVSMETEAGDKCIADVANYATSGATLPLLLLADPQQNQSVVFVVNGALTTTEYVSHRAGPECWRLEAREGAAVPQDKYSTPPILLPPRRATFCGHSNAPVDWVTSDAQEVEFRIFQATPAQSIELPPAVGVGFESPPLSEEGPRGPAPWDMFPINEAIAAGNTDLNAAAYLREHPSARVVRASEERAGNTSTPVPPLAGSALPNLSAESIVRDIVLADKGASEGLSMTVTRTHIASGGHVDQVIQAKVTPVDRQLTDLVHAHMLPDPAYGVSSRIGTPFAAFHVEATPTGRYAYKYLFLGESESIFQFYHQAEWSSEGRLLRIIAPLQAVDSLLPAGSVPLLRP